jgi:hypothetical protein
MNTTATAGVSTSSGLAYWLAIVAGMLFLSIKAAKAVKA